MLMLSLRGLLNWVTNWHKYIWSWLY